MANRVATAGDVTTFAARSKGLLQEGDIILHEGQVNNGGVQAGQLFFQQFATKFATARANAVIWFDATALGTLFLIWFENLGTPIGLGHNIIRPLIGDPIRVVTDSNSNNGQTIVLADFDSIEIDGEFLNKDGYPGMTHGLGVNTFLTGTFGFQVNYGTARSNNLQCQIKVEDGGDVIIRGIEVWGGFAAISVNQGLDAQVNRFIMERIYLHDGHTGEGFYLNRTTGSPRPQVEEILISDCLIARRGTENVQIQSMIAGAVRGQIKNLVSVQSATSWKNAFEDFQDGNAQLLADEGFNEVVNCIFDGGLHCFRVFSTDQGSPDIAVPFEFRKNLIQNFNIHGIYLHSTASEDLRFIFNKLWVRSKGNKQTEMGAASTTQLMDDDGDTTKRSYIDLEWDDSIGSFATSGSDTGSNKANCGESTVVAPEFVKSGFLPDEQVSKWANTYGSYSPNSGVNTTWALGNIMVDGAEGNAYRFYKVTTAHTADGTAPASNPNVVLLTWDTAGVRSDQLGFNSGTTQSYFPPDDWRLVANSFYNKKGLGLLSNPLNTDYTQVQWYRGLNNNPAANERYPIPGARTKKYTPSLVDKGWYISMSVRPRDTNGNYGTQVFGTWKLVS